MNFRIITLPSFKAASSGVDNNFDFSENGILGKFDKYFSKIKPSARDSFMPRDFLYYDEEKEGLVWIWALTEDMDSEDNEIIDFDGGLYLTYTYRDGDDEENGRFYKEAMKYINDSDIFELDKRSNHYIMGHVITPSVVIEAQGWSQMETFIPIKLRK